MGDQKENEKASAKNTPLTNPVSETAADVVEVTSNNNAGDDAAGDTDGATDGNTDDNQAETRVDTRHIAATVQGPGMPRERVQLDLRGQVVSGKYSIEEKLGEGGMGSVFQAYDGLMKRTVAIKLLNQDRQFTEESWQRFHREAQATSQLDHPNIVRIYNFNVCQDHGPYLVMDLIHGQPLSSFIARQSSLDPQFVADVMIQVADALHHAHEKGIVHRDLKPSNILVSAEPGQRPIARVVDFGIAKRLDLSSDELKLTKTGEVFGSPLYMSPEQCLALPLDRRSDIYSLGCVMYESLCGEPPFKGKNFGDTVMKHTKESPAPFPSALQVPNAIKRITFCALEKSPGDRYQTMAALKKELLNFKSGQLVRVKQKRRFWKIAVLVCAATIPITACFSTRDAVKERPEFLATLFMKYHVPQIFEWLILPDDETRIALNAVKIAMQDYRQHKYAQAATLLKGVVEANPDSVRYRRMTAWLLARALARQGKFEEAKDYLAKAYLSDHLLAENLKVVGIMIKMQEGNPKNAKYFFEQAIVHFSKAKENVYEAQCKYWLGTCQSATGEYAEARRNLEEALPVLESSREKNQEKKNRDIQNCKKALAELKEKEHPKAQ